MPRSAVHVRVATADDLPALVALGEQSRDLTGGRAARSGAAAARAAVEARYLQTLADPTRRLVVAEAEDKAVIGMVLLARMNTSALLDTAAVQMLHSAVAAGHRRRGAGKALVAAAVAYAEEIGAGHLVVSVTPGFRDANRFYARLGFAPLAVRRIAPVATVRRKLIGGGRPLAELTRRREHPTART